MNNVNNGCINPYQNWLKFNKLRIQINKFLCNFQMLFILDNLIKIYVMEKE